MFSPQNYPPPAIDPNNPTLSNLKLAIATGSPEEYYPIGTEIPDKWNGQDNPLIVAHYTDITLSDGTVKPGAYLVRKYCVAGGKFGNNSIYGGSSIQNYLEQTYLQSCTAATQSAVATIKIKQFHESYTAKGFFPMSRTEMYGVSDQYTGDSTSYGVPWEYWKNQTGFSSPSNSVATGRIARDISGTVRQCWTRDYQSSANVYVLSSTGTLDSYGVSTRATEYVLPACAVVADD